MSGNILFLGNKIFEIPPFFQTRPGDLGKKKSRMLITFFRPEGWHKHKHKTAGARGNGHKNILYACVYAYAYVTAVLTSV